MGGLENQKYEFRFVMVGAKESLKTLQWEEMQPKCGLGKVYLVIV